MTAQAVEKKIPEDLMKELPLPEQSDKYHPCKKCLGLSWPNFSRSKFFFVGRLRDLRDGRSLRKQAKPKNQWALQRFMSRATGFGKIADLNLSEMGLRDAAPTHFNRPRGGVLLNCFC